MKMRQYLFLVILMSVLLSGIKIFFELSRTPFELVGPTTVSSYDYLATKPKIIIADNNIPYVMWYASEANSDAIYVKYWQDNQWQNTSSEPVIRVERPNNLEGDMAIDSANNLYFIAGYNGYIELQQWQNGVWQQIGERIFTEGTITSLSLAVDSNNIIYVASSNGIDSYVRRYNDAGWHDWSIGNDNNGFKEHIQAGYHPKLVVADENVYLMTVGANSHYDIGHYLVHVSRWHDGQWENMGSHTMYHDANFINANYLRYNQMPDIAVGMDNAVYLAWINTTTYELVVKSWQEKTKSWSDLSTQNITLQDWLVWHRENIAIALSNNNVPYITWIQSNKFDHVPSLFVAKLEGDKWQEVVSGSASWNGINDYGLYDFDPSLAIAPDGIVYIAWRSFSININDDDGSNIYVKRSS